MNVLVLCTGNSARSILLEAILQHFGKGRLTAYSAGSSPTGRVNPAALTLLDELGMAPKHPRSKSWDEFSGPDAPEMDLVITVCGNARDETCPIWPGAPLSAHWGVDDPADVTEPPEAVREAFAKAYAALSKRGQALIALPFETMTQSALKTAIKDIGTQ